MDSPPKPFPLTRFMHHGTFRHYYAFGNTPAEDFLRSVAADPAKPTRPTILSLGCGDIRSCMYTLWKNFGFEGKSVSGFAGVDFVLNDCSAAVLARNVLFLYLCLRMPEDGDSQARKEWVASVWSIWYNHELTPEHDQVLSRALAQLLQWSGTEQEWVECRLGVMVRFSSPATFRTVKQMWQLWYGQKVKVESVEVMKRERRRFQAFHFQKRVLGIPVDTEEMIAMKLISPLRFHSGYPQEKIDTMIKECSDYLESGSTFAETVLNLPRFTGKTSINLTLFERANGLYTLHYGLVPYSAFHLAVLYSPVEVSRMIAKSEAVLPLFPVAEKNFKKTPLLANSVQQFAMWLTATAKMMKQSKDCKVSFTLDCSDAIDFCQTLFHFPEHYTGSLGLSGPPQFDAIYTSNLLDPLLGASALILVTSTLLKPGGALFTTSFHYKAKHGTSNEYIERMFGFLPELLPVILGIRCIGHDGQYSSTVAPQPIPPCVNSTYFFQPVYAPLVWKNIISQPIINPSPSELARLTLHLLNSCISILDQHCTVDCFLVIAKHFLANIQTETSPSHQFWEPLCKQITEKPALKPHLIQLQTQSLLHGLHMHITVTEADCPLCRGQPLNKYIGGYTMSFTVASVVPYEEPIFLIEVGSSTSDTALITSFAAYSNGADVHLSFFFPKRCAKKYQHFRVYRDFSGRELTDPYIVAGRLQDISSCSLTNYFFMKHDQLSTSTPMQSSLGEIIKHIGDATRFETTVSITDECIFALEKTALKAERSKTHKLQVRCGQMFIMTIAYPYPIQSNVHIKLSKKRKTLSITAERLISCSYEDDPTFYVDPNNVLALPWIHSGDRRIRFHFLLQTPLPAIDPIGPLYMKFILIQLADMAPDKHFVITFPSKCSPGNPDIHGMIIVHNVHFDPYFLSSVINISFCFPKQLPETFSFWGQLSENKCCVLQVDEEKYKILQDVLTSFSNKTRKKHGNPGIPPALVKHKGWQYFQQALIHPLYPNTEIPFVEQGVQCFLFNFVGSKRTSDMHSCNTSPELEQQYVSRCTYCKQMCTTLKKCGRCGTIQYCGKECQTKHWKEHKRVCKSPSNETASILISCANCNKKTNLRRCSCQSVAYCSKECQKLDWPSHQDSCTSRRKTCLKTAPSSMADPLHQNEQKSQSQSEAGSVEPKLQDTCDASIQKCGKCSNCNKAVVQQLKWCPCHKAAYCSIECQRLNWPLHKPVCTSIKKLLC